MAIPLENPVVPIASPDDAIGTYEQLRSYLLDHPFTPILVYVVENADGAPDKAGVERREEYGDNALILLPRLNPKE